MTLHSWLAWGDEHLFVCPEQWQRDKEHPRLREFRVLDHWRATGVLYRIAHDDPAFLCRLAREVLPTWSPDYPARDSGWGTYDRNWRLRAALERELGAGWSELGEPPAYARVYVCERRPSLAPVAQPEPRKTAHAAVEAARNAPRGWVAVEAVTEAGEPVPRLELEIVLSDAQVVVRATDASGVLRLDPVPQGRCSIRVPGLDVSAWRAAEGPPAVPFRKTYKRAHVVRRGDNLTRVAALYGIRGWRKLWDAADNQPLRQRRASPHLLYPGDEVIIPALECHEITRPTDQTHRIVVREARTQVRVRLQDLAGHALGGLSYEYQYVLGSRQVRAAGSASSDSDGWLEELVPLGVDELEVLTQRPRLRLLFPLHRLDPARQRDTAEPIVAGVHARLSALGYAGPPAADGPDPWREAIAAFQSQELARRAADGELDAETAAAVERRYSA